MPVKKYEQGKYKIITESERQRAFVRACPDECIINQADNIADYLQDFGIVSAKELMLMLSVWLCDPANKNESERYWRILSGKIR